MTTHADHFCLLRISYEDEMNMLETHHDDEVKRTTFVTSMDSMRYLERKNLALEESNALLQEDNQDLKSKLEVAVHHHHKDVTETLLTDLEQGIMMMMKEKLNLQNTIKALEHQFVQVESKDDADNDKRERRGPKRMINWMSDMFLL